MDKANAQQIQIDQMSRRQQTHGLMLTMVAHHKTKMAPLTKDFRVDLEEGGILSSEESNAANEATKGDDINNKSQHSSVCGSSWFWQKNNDLQKPICLVHPWAGLYVTSVLLRLLGSLYFHLAVEKWLLWIVAVVTAVIIGSSISVKNLQNLPAQDVVVVSTGRIVAVAYS
jgi:hypothetical protein